MDNQRLFLYASLFFVGLLIWQQWQSDYNPEWQTTESSAAAQTSANPATTPELSQSAGLDTRSNPDLLPADTLKGSADAQAQTVTVKTDVIEAEIDTRGGVIKSLKLLDYPVDLEHPDQPLELLFDRSDANFVVQTGLQSKSNAAPTHHEVFQVEKLHYELAANAEKLVVPMVWQQDGVRVIKSFVFKRGDYLLDVKQQVENNSGKNWIGNQYRQLSRTEAKRESMFLYTYTGGVIYSQEEKYEKINFADMADAPLRRSVVGGWIAMIQHYFMASFIPDPNENDLFYSLYNNSTLVPQYSLGMRSENLNIEDGQSGQFHTLLYAGPKLPHRLQEIAEGLELTVDYGYLTFLSKPMYIVLEWLHGILGNWGFAIIVLTILIKVLFYKLSETSYRSMARMRNLAPKLASLKDRYGDDRQRMNQAMMDLYKTEKINPLGGCLPMLIQIPFFIALYWALLESVELRQAPFILWIQDLSVPDPWFVLPLIMGVSMFIQQKLNPAPPDPIQAKVLMVLPIMMAVFFVFFPAGLVLYWVVNNILSITQQYIITKRIESGAEK